jgi:hypothetical protein
LRALNGELIAWTSRGPKPVHSHRLNDGSWWSNRATAYFVVSPMADCAYADAHRWV